MYRIAVHYESQLGRNDGNPLYVNSCLKRVQYFCDVKLERNRNEKLVNSFPNGKIFDPKAEELADWVLDNVSPDGIEVMHLRPYGDMKPYGEFDLNIWVDWGEDGLGGILPYEPVWPSNGPIAYWASDTHLGYDYRLAMAKKSDIVFVAQERARKEFARDGVEATWLPHAFEPLAYPRQEYASKKYDVAFVGHVNSENRIDAIDRLFSEFPNFFFGQRLFNDAAEIYGQSKICFNIAMKDDINMRCFEVMGAGGFLLTDELPTMKDLPIIDGIHCGLYKNLDDMVKKARYYLANPEERDRIAQVGHSHVMRHHTIANRVKTILEQAVALKKETV